MIRIGDRIDGRYRITSRIATGGMADVYEANDLVNHRLVCLKVMKEDLMKDQENLRRFQRETESMSSIDSPNVVKVYGHGFIEGRPYMAVEFIKAQTLRERLEFQGALSPIEACEVMIQLSTGVSQIHGKGIIHRDIKPENVFYLSDGTLKISDFGIASQAGSYDDSGTIQATVYYAAPEILTGGHPEYASDIYSMGIVFYELLTGRLPFEGNNIKEIAMMHIEKHVPDVSKVNKKVPASVAKIVAKCCRKRPEERYSSAEELGKVIDEALKNRGQFAEKKSFFERIFGFK